MKSKIIFILIVGIIFLVIWQLPRYIDRLSAEKVVKSVLKCWKENDDACAQQFWLEASSYKRLSPVESFSGFRTLMLDEDKEKIWIHMYIHQGHNVSPDSGEWEFLLLKSKGRWKISYYGVFSY